MTTTNPANNLGFVLSTSETANIYALFTIVLPPNDLEPTVTLSSAGILRNVSLVGNYPTTVGTAPIVFYANWSGGEPPYTVNLIITNAISGAFIANTMYKGINATYNSISYTPGSGVQIKANIIVKDSEVPNVIANSTYRYFPVQIGAVGSPSTIGTGQQLVVQGFTSGGALLFYTYNVVYRISNSNTGTIMNTFTYNNVVSGATNTYTFTIPNTWGGNYITANAQVTYTVVSGSFTAFTNTVVTVNTVKLANVLVNGANALSNPTLALSNTLIDVGQKILFTSTVQNGVSPYTYNFLIVNTLGTIKNPLRIMYYVPTFSGSACALGTSTLCGYNTIIQNKYGLNDTTEVDIFSTQIALGAGNVPSISYDSGGLSAGQINQIISNAVTEGIDPVITLGGSGQTINIVNTILSNSVVQSWVIGNIVNAIKGSGLSTLPYNGVAIDFEGGFQGGSNGILFTDFIKNLHANVIAINASYQVQCYVSDGGNATGFTGANNGPPEFNYIALAPYCTHFDYLADGGGNVYADVLNLASQVGGTSHVTFGLDAGDSPFDTEILQNIQGAIANDLGLSTYASGFTTVANAQVLNSIGTNIINYNLGGSSGNVVIGNQLYTSVASTSNTYFYSPPTNLITNTSYAANVVIKDSSGAIVNTTYIPFGYNSTLIDNLTIVKSSLTAGNTQTVTPASLGTGTSPYVYNIQVFNSIGLVYNSLSVSTSANSVTNTFTQQSTWGSGTFTVNTYVTDSATTKVTASNSLTYSVSAALASTSFTISNAVTDQNDYEVLNGIISGGSSPFSYNFLVYNSAGLVTNQLYTGVSTTSNSFVFQMQSTWGTGTFTANLVVKDSLSNTVTNTLTFTVDTALHANPPTPTTANIDNGQTITLTANPTGGTGSYTLYQWYTDSNNNCVSLSIIGGATSSTYAASPSSNTFYCYIVTDSALGAATSSAPANIIVNAAMNTPSITTPTISNQIVGNTLTFTTAFTGGSTPYTYNWQLVNSITNVLITNSLVTNSYTGNTFSWVVTFALAGNTVYANVIVTDSASTPAKVNSINSGVITLSTVAAVAPTISLSNTISANEVEVIQGSASDNAKITASGTIGDTVQIWKQGGTSYLANGVTTVTLAYNALAGSATTGLYANDISDGLTSTSNVLVRRIAVAYDPKITFTNQQAVAVSANTPLMITYNALNWTVYESKSLNNTMLAYLNGTIAPSWIEGNLLNEVGNANVLYQSANVIWWALSPPTNTFLAANTGTATTNQLILAFAAVSNNVWDGNVIGAEFQLANTIIGITTTTAKSFDSGNVVFSYYQNFGSSGLPSGYSQTTGGTFTYSSTNAQILSGSAGTYNQIMVASPPSANTFGNTVEALMNVTGTGGAGTVGSALAISSSNPLNGCVSGQYILASRAGVNNFGACVAGSATNFAYPYNKTNVYSISEYNAITANMTINYISRFTKTNNAAATGANIIIATSNAVNPLTLYWVRTRPNPPNNATPSLSFSPSQQFTFQTFSVSNTVVLANNAPIVFNAVIQGGTGTFTYNFQVFNDLTGALVANMLVTNALTYNTWTWIPPASLANTVIDYVAKVAVTDSETNPVTVNSLRSGGIYIINNWVKPSGIVAYSNITLSNFQGVNSSKSFDQMIVFNAIAFKTVSNNGLSNIKFFWGANGMILNSWLEGNLLNELQTSSLNTSANIIFWVKLPYALSQGQSFLGSNSIIGIAFNSMSSNSLNATVGESGILSNSITGQTCSTYDNGANVFAYYQTFCGLSSLPSGWTASAGTTVTFGTTNTQILTGTNGNDNQITLNPAPLSGNTPGNILRIFNEYYNFFGRWSFNW